MIEPVRCCPGTHHVEKLDEGNLIDSAPLDRGVKVIVLASLRALHLRPSGLAGELESQPLRGWHQ